MADTIIDSGWRSGASTVLSFIRKNTKEIRDGVSLQTSSVLLHSTSG